ncbi:glycosyltransferase domain protein [Mycobacterium xenopi 4042]|uniref:Glycosyltransferase domain protein n=1 Tax=Mycobacterium xenopi 4042 TaxID=1299334 RepID=X8DMC6_MYCXE|nr:glycosyltransferase domain protein [Mycobacterium xenopi 4042]
MSIDVFCRRAALEVDDLRGAIELVCPDVVIVDANCWGAMSFADAKTLRWGVFSPFTPFLRSPGVPPFGPGLRPWPGTLAGSGTPPCAPLWRTCSTVGSCRHSTPFAAGWARRQSGRSTSFYVEHRCCWPWVANRWNTRTPAGVTLCI